jgi:hypothetical protein
MAKRKTPIAVSRRQTNYADGPIRVSLRYLDTVRFPEFSLENCG